MIEEGVGVQKPEGESGELLLSKFAVVWVWTILIGINGGLSYHYTNVLGEMFQGLYALGNVRRPGMPGAPADWTFYVAPLSTSVGVLASIGSWLCLYWFFTFYAMPIVLFRSATMADDRRRRTSENFLKRSYQLLIVAGVARVAPSLIMMFASLTNR